MSCVIIVLYIKFLIFLNLLYFISSTINPRSKYKEDNHDSAFTCFGSLSQNVFDRQLVNSEPLATDIITQNGGYFKNTTIRKFRGKIMTYVSLWQNNGYDASITWGGKFDILTPDWFRICRVGKNSYKYFQKNNIDNEWVHHIRNLTKTKQKTIEIYPRVALVNFTRDDFTTLFSEHTERKALYKLIVQACNEYKFDGIATEIWLDLYNKLHIDHLYNYVLELGNALKTEGFKLILMVPAWTNNKPNAFTANHFENLYSYVDYFGIVTYGYSSKETPGPTAPLTWMKNAVEKLVPSSATNSKLKRKKILMSLNLFGFDYTSEGARIISRKDYLNLLKNYNNRLKFDDVNIENFFMASDSEGRHVVFYPTLYSINERIKLAEELGVGLSLIELSCGLNYFFDLF